MQYNPDAPSAPAMRSAKLLPLPLVLLVGVAAPARAEDLRAGSRREGSTFSLGAFAGGHVFAQGANLGVVGGEQNQDGAKSAVLGGLRAQLALGRWLVAEAELVGLATEDRVYQRKARILGYRINGLAPLRSGAFRPFVLLGAGAMQVASSDAQGSAGLALDTKAEVHTGIGFDYRVAGVVSVRGDARVLQVPSKQSWGLTTDLEAMVGASVAFGAERRPSRPVEAPAVPPVAATVETPVPIRVAKPEPTLPPAPAEKAAAAPVVSEAEPRSAGAAESTPAAPDEGTAAAKAHSVSDLLERAREIRFESAGTKLTAAAQAFLGELAAALVSEPAARLEIVVHVASSGDAKRDWSISRRRAEAIKYLLVEKGASVDQLIAIGRGSEDPIAPNLTRTGRMRNERVELHRASAPAQGR